IREAVDFSSQVADALTDAHSLGIVHCDIKSANLIVNERGLVKLFDFGISRVIEDDSLKSPGDQTRKIGRQTELGVVIGTAAYMSPEQAMGRAVDQRSDIFSLGVVMYEMLTGRLPFEGQNSVEIIDKIIHEEPLPLARLNYSVPILLEQIVRKSLEKDRERRYQSARELLIDLRNFKRDLDSGTRGTSSLDRGTQVVRKPRTARSRTINSLAILPLVNATNDTDTDYLSDGITESIINNLAQLPKLRVMARSTVFRYKGHEVDPRDVGRELGVRAVLTGRVFLMGDRLVIKTELVDTEDGAHLWGEQYNRTLSDIFSIEEEISREISEKLRLKLSGEQKRKLAKRHTEKTAAYQLYLKGRYYWNKRTEEGLKKGIEHFQQAINLDPNYALAYAGLADSYNLLASYSTLSPDEAFKVAKQAATRALELDSSLAEAHVSMAATKNWYDWDWEGAEKEYRRAIELNPSYATAYQWYALDLAGMGRIDEALEMMKRAQDLDPLSLIISLNVARVYYFARDYDRAIEQCRKALEMFPDFALALRRLGQAYSQKQMYPEAIEAFRSAIENSHNDSETMAALAHTFALSGRPEEAERILSDMMEMSKTLYVSPYSVARVHTGLGDKEQALDWLEKACEQRHGILAYLKVEPVFDPLRSEPRFIGLLRKMGLSE
ncbi:MAG TPA: protein kinase, partial [Blastocatellia bacterium]|nr:protein kinase [Blastocatellia bacterium]